MKYISAKISFSIFTLFLLFMAFGCGGSNNSPYSPIISTTGSTGTGATPDFSVVVSPAQQSMQNGSSGAVANGSVVATNQVTFTITVGSSTGFVGNIGLSSSSQTGFTTGFSKTPISLDATHSSATSDFTITRTQALSRIGKVPFTVTAASNGKTHTSTATVQLVSSDTPTFTVRLSPKSEIVNQHVTGAREAFTGRNVFDVRVTALAGFTGTVNLSISGLSNSFSTTFGSTSVALTNKFSIVDVPLTISGTGTSTNNFAVTGKSGSQTSSDTASLVQNGTATYSVTLSPSSVTMSDLFGTTVNTTVFVTSVNGFAGTVNLSLPSQNYGFFSGSFKNTSVNLSANGTSSTILTLVTQDTGIVDGTYPLIVSGVSGGQTQLGAGNLTLTSSGGLHRSR